MSDDVALNNTGGAGRSAQETHGHSAAAVGQQLRQGIRWNLIGAVVTNATRVAVLAVLGRALTKDDFGIVAAGISVYVVVFTIRDLGIGTALVQRKELVPGHIATAFATSVYLGFVLSITLILVAPWIGRAYGIVESVGVIRALAVMFAIRSVATTSRMMCQRAMNFRFITTVDTLAFTAGSVAAMVSAVAGAGPWALAIGYLVEEALSAVCYLVRSPPHFSLRIQRERLRELLDFGGHHSVVLIAGLVATFGDNFIVGRTLGAGQLGFYSRAYDLMRFPSMAFDALVGSVLFPAFARLQHDPVNVATSFRRLTLVNGLLFLPATVALIIVAPEAIRTILGEGWDGAVLPFQILLTVMLPRTSLKLGVLIAQALGAVRAVAITQIFWAVSLVGGALVTVRWGIVGVAVSTSVSTAAAGLWSSYLVLRLAEMPIRRFVGAHVPGLLLAVLSVATIWPVTQALRSVHWPPTLIFATVALTSIAGCLVGLTLALRVDRGDLPWLKDELRRAVAKLIKVSGKNKMISNT